MVVVVVGGAGGWSVVVSGCLSVVVQGIGWTRSMRSSPLKFPHGTTTYHHQPTNQPTHHPSPPSPPLPPLPPTTTHGHAPPRTANKPTTTERHPHTTQAPTTTQHHPPPTTQHHPRPRAPITTHYNPRPTTRPLTAPPYRPFNLAHTLCRSAPSSQPTSFSLTPPASPNPPPEPTATSSPNGSATCAQPEPV